MGVAEQPLYTAEQIQQRVAQLAQQISSDYRGKELVVISILKGAVVFTADLIRRIEVPLTLDFIAASSYAQASSTGEVKIHCDIRTVIDDRHVLLVDDIVDTGISLQSLRARLSLMKPASLRSCVLLNKAGRRRVDVPVEYVGFMIPNCFVVGYGLDYDERYRRHPYLAIFQEE